MDQAFYKGRTNNHLNWVMVDETDFATPESALSAATKIKVYGQLEGATGTNFITSGTGSLTNDITHVGASVLGLYHIALANADLSDASAAWYDTYIIALSAAGAARQTLIVEGRQCDTSFVSGALSDLYSLMSDFKSDFQSRVPKAVATNSQLSDLHSDVKSMLTVMSGVQSDIYSAVSDLQSDFQSRVPKAVATNSQLSDLQSDLRSVLAGMSDILSNVKASADRISFKQNTAFTGFTFLMVDSTDHITPKTGLTVAGTRSRAGAAFAAVANAITEVGNGVYTTTLAGTDLNSNIITFRFTATGADDRYITIKTIPA